MAASSTVYVGNVPHVVVEEELEQALEEVLGKGSVVLCSVLRARDSGKSKGKAYVQFREEEVATKAVQLSSAGQFRLYNQELSLGILQKKLGHLSAPVSVLCERCKVDVGCLTSENTLLSLWSYRDRVMLEWDADHHTFSIHMGFPSMNYKVAFPLSEIQRLEIISTKEESTGFVIELKENPPYLYCQPTDDAGSEDKYIDFLIKNCVPSKLTRPESVRAWIRTTDFTVAGVMGQSFTYVVEVETPGVWKEVCSLLHLTGSLETSSRSFSIKVGAPYSAEQLVVPMINPQSVRVPFDVLYKINNLIQYGKVCGPSLDENFFKLVSSSSSAAAVRLALQALSNRQGVCYDASNYIRRKIDEMKKMVSPGKVDSGLVLGPGKALVHKVLVTPLKVFCLGPEVEQSNRILRRFKENTSNFLRVHFVDEDLHPLSSSVLTSDVHSSYSDVFRRIKMVLKEGIYIGSRNYEFLAFSSSQLRDAQLWMVAQFYEKSRQAGREKVPITAEYIRSQMGDFSQIRNVAKCAARMGQCFSSSTETMKVLPLQVKK